MTVQTHFDVMVDLETLGKTPGCVILSLGAVQFDLYSGNLGAEFYQVVNTESCLKAGLTTEESTIEWWGRQSDEARVTVTEAESTETSYPLFKVLTDFGGFLHQFNLKTVRVWGNGADFDNAILACGYQAIRQPLPWKFYHNRCHRTLKSFAPDIKKVFNKDDVKHNALTDAKVQAVQALEIFATLEP